MGTQRKTPVLPGALPVVTHRDATAGYREKARWFTLLIFSMAITASHTPYLLENFQGPLESVLHEAEQRMTATHREEIRRGIQNDQNEFFIRKYQLPLAGCKGRVFTFAELSESWKYEQMAQVILPSSIREILLGKDGLIRRAGGGRSRFLLQDIQVGFITDILSGGPPEGPVVLSGRNRFIAVQALLHIAAPDAEILNMNIRTQAVAFPSSDILCDAIGAANAGRAFPRSEQRSKKAASIGIDLTSKQAMEASVKDLRVQPPAPAIVGAWLLLTAADQELNGMSGTQVSEAGASLVNKLAKTVRPGGVTLGTFFKRDTGHLFSLCRALEPVLERSMLKAVADPAGGTLSGKLAAQLLPTAITYVSSRG